MSREDILELLKESQQSATADSTADSTAEEEVGFFQSIINWFGSEGFSPKNNKFDRIYSVFSIIVIYIFILKDPLKINNIFQK
jgi:hypothetical protein